jgi:hypothetical protein
MALTGRLLERSGFAFWDLGQDFAYKAKLGATLWPRLHFLECFHRVRDTPSQLESVAMVGRRSCRRARPAAPAAPGDQKPPFSPSLVTRHMPHAPWLCPASWHGLHALRSTALSRPHVLILLPTRAIGGPPLLPPNRRTPTCSVTQQTCSAQARPARREETGATLRRARYPPRTASSGASALSAAAGPADAQMEAAARMTHTLARPTSRRAGRAWLATAAARPKCPPGDRLGMYRIGGDYDVARMIHRICTLLASLAARTTSSLLAGAFSILLAGGCAASS